MFRSLQTLTRTTIKRNFSSVSHTNMYNLAQAVPIISPTHTVPIFESLYEISKAGHNIRIPRIVMLGNQSSGKTSLVEAMCSINNLFEKKAGMATKRPVYIYLNKIAEGEADYVKVGKLGEKYSNMDKARHRISEENNIDGISEEPLDVAIYSPNISHSCNLIDLPGFISTVKQDQDEGLPAKIKKINEKYIIDDSNLKLIVLSATEDVALSLALREIKKSHQLKNSIGVFTKIDLITNSQLGTKHLEELLLDRSYTSFKCIGVKLRSTADMQNGVTIPQMIASEREFIQTYKLENKPDIKVGLDVLMGDISNEQIRRISHELPEIRRQLTTMLEKKRHGNTVLDRLIASNDMSDISKELDRIITEIHPESDLRIELEKKIYDKVNAYVKSFVFETKDGTQVYKLTNAGQYGQPQPNRINLNGVRALMNSTGSSEHSDPDLFSKSLMYGMCKADVQSGELDKVQMDNFHKSLITPFFKLEKVSSYNKASFIRSVHRLIDKMVISKFSENIVNIVLNEIKEHILQKDGDVDDIGKVFFVHIFDKICERANQDELKRAITRMIIRERRLNLDYPQLIHNIHMLTKDKTFDIEKHVGFLDTEKYPATVDLYGSLMLAAYMQCLAEAIARDSYRLTSENLLDPIITNAIKYSLDTVSKKDFTNEQAAIKVQIDKFMKQLETLDAIIEKNAKPLC